MLPLTWGSWGKVAWATLNSSVCIAIFYNVVFCTVIAFAVWTSSMKKAGAAKANFFRYAVPAAAVVAGFLFYDETILIGQILGGLLMAAGLIWIGMEKKAVL